jgi:hypothetical protein
MQKFNQITPTELLKAYQGILTEGFLKGTEGTERYQYN